MTSEHLKIICVEKGNEISRIIRTVYGSLKFLLETIDGSESIQTVLDKRAANLLVIDNRTGSWSAEDANFIIQTNPQLFIILIGDDEHIIKQLAFCKYVKFVSAKHLIDKFPLVLSDAYNDYSNGIYSGIGYRKLLKESLFRLSGLLITVTEDGHIVFLNHDAEKLVGTREGVYRPSNIMDMLVDGPRSWKYIIESCCKSDAENQSFLVRFMNADQEEITKNIEVLRIVIDKPYFMLHEKHKEAHLPETQATQEFQLLDKFSESVANELLNPVNVMSGRLQLLKSVLDQDEKSEKHLDAITKQVKRIDEIIAKLLTFARLKQDFIPQKIQINDLLMGLKLEPSIDRLLQRSSITLDLELQNPGPVITGQVAHFDLMLKTLLEVSFECLGSFGEIIAGTNILPEHNEVFILLNHTQELFDDVLSLHTYLSNTAQPNRQKSIETTIIKQVVQQYGGSYKLTRPDKFSEKLELHFPFIQTLVEEAQ